MQRTFTLLALIGIFALSAGCKKKPQQVEEDCYLIRTQTQKQSTTAHTAFTFITTRGCNNIRIFLPKIPNGTWKAPGKRKNLKNENAFQFDFKATPGAFKVELNGGDWKAHNQFMKAMLVLGKSFRVPERGLKAIVKASTSHWWQWAETTCEKWGMTFPTKPNTLYFKPVFQGNDGELINTATCSSLLRVGCQTSSKLSDPNNSYDDAIFLCMSKESPTCRKRCISYATWLKWTKNPKEARRIYLTIGKRPDRIRVWHGHKPASRPTGQ